MIESDLYSALSNDATVSGYVGTKIYPSVAPKGTAAPYIVYKVVSIIPQNHLTGESDMKNKRVEINIYAKDYGDAQAIYAAVDVAVKTLAAIKQSFVQLWDTDPELHRFSVDYSIWKKEV